MTQMKWDEGLHPCPKCDQLALVHDGYVRWRSGARPPREKATQENPIFTWSADFKVAGYLHCANCLTWFYDPADGGAPNLYVDEGLEESKDQPVTGWRPGSIGDVSARLGDDVRDLKMAGYSDDEIDQVLYGRLTLEELLEAGPGKKGE